MDYRFRFDHDIVIDNLYELNHVEGIDDFTVSAEAVKEITKLLKLDYRLDCEDLRAIRNSVVMVYSAFSEHKEYRVRMSAITAVIDDAMWRRFGHV